MGMGMEAAIYTGGTVVVGCLFVFFLAGRPSSGSVLKYFLYSVPLMYRKMHRR